MNEYAMLAVPLIVFGCAMIAVFRVGRERAMWVGATSAVAMAVAVPSFATPAPVAIAAVVGTIVVLAIALVRDRYAVVGLKFPVLLLCFIVWSTVFGSIGSPPKMILLYMATGTLLTVLTFVVIGASTRGHNLFLPLFGVVLVFEVLYGFAEEFLGAKALWPRANGTDVIENRVNPVFPQLVGRAMGSTSQPIPYGMLLGFCVVVCLWFAVRRRSVPLGITAGLGIVGMVFSGTRSAFISLVAALVLWVLMKFWRKPAVTIPLAVVGVAGGVGAMLLAVRGNGEVFSSDSFVHRLGILETAGNLLVRNPLEVIFGSGYQSTGALIDAGVVHGVDGIGVFDQEFIRTLASVGLIGLALLIAALVMGFVRGSDLTRLLIVFLSVGFFTFDGYSWRLIACLFVLVVAHGFGAKGGAANDERFMRGEFPVYRRRLRESGI